MALIEYSSNSRFLEDTWYNEREGLTQLSILDLTEEIGKIDTVKRVDSTLLGYK